MSEAFPKSGLSALAQADRFQLLVEAVKDYAIYLLDADGRVATWNTGAQRFKGYTADQIIGQHFSVFYTAEDRARDLPGRALQTAATEGRFESEGWRVRRDGSEFWTHVVIDPVTDDDGVLIGFAKITRDITEKRAIDEALIESEQRFRLLVQGVRDYAIYMLDPQGNVTNWNAGAELIKGYTADEIVGRHFSVFYTEDDQARGEPERILALCRAEGKYEGEAQRVRKNGEVFWAHILIDAIHNETGRLIGFAKVTRDITERRKTQLDLEQSRAALVQAQKMEAIGRLTGGVAHDFNNLLTVIRASADFLQRDNLADAQRRKYVNAIAETAERAAKLTSQLLAFARRQPLNPEVFDITGRLRSLQQLMETTVGSAVAVVLHSDVDGLVVEADTSQFETAVLNMVINARDAMPSGGDITIKARPVKSIPAVRGHAAARGDFIAVEITDNGTGIAEANLANIFEPFFTTKAIDKGTGLGLSQVYGFAKQSKGEIDVRSEVGAGTSFTLYLPRSTAKAPEAVGSQPALNTASLADMRILLVEDNEDVGNFASGLLGELCRTVTWVGDAQSALHELEADHGAYDLVFSDVVMPGTSGVELGRLIRKRWPNLPVVLTSGYSHVIVEEGSHGFPLLKKPYTVDDLIDTLAKAGTVRA